MGNGVLVGAVENVTWVVNECPVIVIVVVVAVVADVFWYSAYVLVYAYSQYYDYLADLRYILPFRPFASS